MTDKLNSFEALFFSLRSLLYMATMSAVQRNPVFRDHYQQLLKRGKATLFALVACLRKLVAAQRDVA